MTTETTETVETEETETEATEAAEEVESTEEAAPETDQYKAKWEGQRKVSRDLERKLNEANGKLADVDKTAGEKALDAARREGESSANKRLVAAEFRSAAAKRVKDPRIAAKLVDLTGVEVDGDGEVDADGIAAALDALLEEYPDLAPSRFEGTADQGARGKASAPSQLTRDDLKNMTPQAILKAEKEGRLDRLKGKTK